MPRLTFESLAAVKANLVGKMGSKSYWMWLAKMDSSVIQYCLVYVVGFWTPQKSGVVIQLKCAAHVSIPNVRRTNQLRRESVLFYFQWLPVSLNHLTGACCT